MKKFNNNYLAQMLLALSLVLMATGCGNFKAEISVSDDSGSYTPDISVPSEIGKVRSFGFVPGSTPYQNSYQRNYKVFASVGNGLDQLVSTSGRGYKLHSSVHGVLLPVGAGQQ